VHRGSTWVLSMNWALQGLGVALAHDTVANDLIASGRLVRLLDYSMPMKEAYYLIAPEGSLINPAAKVFKEWLWREIKG
jgi:LysR family glycine cleavage system transcriptional activator